MFRFFQITGEECEMYLKSGNITFMVVSSAKKLAKVIYELLLKNYQENISENMKGCGADFDIIARLYYSCPKITFNFGVSYSDSSKQLKKLKISTCSGRQ